MRRRLVPILLLASLGLLPGRARAVSDVVGGFPLLDDSPRGTALGGTLTALAEGPEAICWNPAGLLAMARPTFSFAYADLFNLGLVSHTTVQFGYPFQRSEIGWANGRIHREVLPPPAGQALGLAISSLHGDLDVDSYRETEVTLAYAWLAPGRLWAGIAGQLLLAQTPIASAGGHGQALNLGVQRPVGPFRLGIAAVNLTSWMKWDISPVETQQEQTPETSEPLPERWSVALAWSPSRYPVDATIQRDWVGGDFAGVQTGAGAEWSPLPLIVLRGGIRRRDDVLGGHNEWSAGAGFKLGQFRVDYGVENNAEDLGLTHRWGASVQL